MAPRVFISYAHDDEAHKERVRALADRLRSEGVDVELDQYTGHPREGWPKWMEKQISNADLVLVVTSQQYLDRFTQSDGENASGCRFEGNLISNRLFAEACSFERFAVACVDPTGEQYVPPVLAGCPRYSPCDEPGYDQLYRFLTGQPVVCKPPIGPIRRLANRRLERVIKPDPETIADFPTLCSELKPLLDRNGEAFRAFGPRSGCNGRSLDGFDVALWHKARENDIRPTNRAIAGLIDQHAERIPQQHREVFENLRQHIFAFDAHCDDPNIDYRDHQFPLEVLGIVNANVTGHIS